MIGYFKLIVMGFINAAMIYWLIMWVVAKAHVVDFTWVTGIAIVIWGLTYCVTLANMSTFTFDMNECKNCRGHRSVR